MNPPNYPPTQDRVPTPPNPNMREQSRGSQEMGNQASMAQNQGTSDQAPMYNQNGMYGGQQSNSNSGYAQQPPISSSAYPSGPNGGYQQPMQYGGAPPNNGHMYGQQGQQQIPQLQMPSQQQHMQPPQSNFPYGQQQQHGVPQMHQQSLYGQNQPQGYSQHPGYAPQMMYQQQQYPPMQQQMAPQQYQTPGSGGMPHQQQQYHEQQQTSMGQPPHGQDPRGPQTGVPPSMGTQSAQPMGTQRMGSQPMAAQPMGSQPAGSQPMYARPGQPTTLYSASVEPAAAKASTQPGNYAIPVTDQAKVPQAPSTMPPSGGVRGRQPPMELATAPAKSNKRMKTTGGQKSVSAAKSTAAAKSSTAPKSAANNSASAQDAEADGAGEEGGDNENRRQRNRIAARKSRQRKLDRVQQLMAEKEELEKRHSELEKETEMLQKALGQSGLEGYSKMSDEEAQKLLELRISVIQKIAEAYNTGKMEDVVKFFSRDTVISGPQTPILLRGRQAIQLDYACTTYLYENIHLKFTSIAYDGPRSKHFRASWVFTGTVKNAGYSSSKEFVDIMRRLIGRQITITGVSSYSFSGEAVVYLHRSSNQAELLWQLVEMDKEQGKGEPRVTSVTENPTIQPAGGSNLVPPGAHQTGAPTGNGSGQPNP